MMLYPPSSLYFLSLSIAHTHTHTLPLTHPLTLSLSLSHTHTHTLTQGRIEAVMVSCPPLVAWEYNHVPAIGSEEERLMKILKLPVDWC